MRQNGEYFVKREIVWHGPPRKVEIKWIVAEYKYGAWYLPGQIAEFKDSSFLEIDERRIERETSITQQEEDRISQKEQIIPYGIKKAGNHPGLI